MNCIRYDCDEPSVPGTNYCARHQFRSSALGASVPSGTRPMPRQRMRYGGLVILGLIVIAFYLLMFV